MNLKDMIFSYRPKFIASGRGRASVLSLSLLTCCLIAGYGSIAASTASLPDGADDNFFNSTSDEVIALPQGRVPANLAEALLIGLPVVEITTENGEEPTVEAVSPPEGSMGNGSANATKVPGSVTVYAADGSVMYSSGEYESKKSGMTVKIRGNSSARLAKKPFKIKLQKKGDMLGRGDSRFNDKNWVLIHDSQLRNYFCQKVGEVMGIEWNPAMIPVNVIFNGDFRGMYLLGEGIEANSKCRIDVEDDGFVLEHDPYWWTENGEYLLSVDNPRYNYTFKYPDYEDVDEATLQQLQDFLNTYESKLADGSYDEIIDVKSYANWVLSHDLLGTTDGGGVNWYICKRSMSDDSKVTCGPLWDFDSAHGADGRFSPVHTGRFKILFESRNPLFLEEYISRWHEVRDNAEEKIGSLIDEFTTPRWSAYDVAMNYNDLRWNEQAQRISTIVENLKEWYDARFPWIDKEVAKMESSVGTVVDSFHEGYGKTWMLSGRHLLLAADVGDLRVYAADGSLLFQTAITADSDIDLEAIAGSGTMLIIVCDGDSRKVVI